MKGGKIILVVNQINNEQKTRRKALMKYRVPRNELEVFKNLVYHNDVLIHYIK